MGLSKCPDCGGNVSTRATACPHCGAPVPHESGTESSSPMTCFMFFGQSSGLFWRGPGEPADVETAD